MLLSNLPSTKLSIPFASSAGAGYIRSIPVASQIGITAGAASLTDGFPPLNTIPIESGGVPPFGQDMNGILNEISSWTRWQNAGGLIPYDSAFSSLIGGYPQSALLAGTALGTIFLSLDDNNTADPNTGGSTWTPMATAKAVQNGLYTWAGTFGGTANALTATLSPTPTALVAGMTVGGIVGTTSTGAVTINVNGLGPVAVVDKSGSPIIAGFWQANDILSLICDGTSFRVVGGQTTVTTAFSSSYSTSQALSNNVLSQSALTAGSAAFGAVASNAFTFTRPGSYNIAARTTVGVVQSAGNSNFLGAVQIRKNNVPVVGGYSEDSSFGNSGTFNREVNVTISVAAGDAITLWAQCGASSGYVSASIVGMTIAIQALS